MGVVRIPSTYCGISEIYETLRFMRHICDGCYITVTPPFCNLPPQVYFVEHSNLSSLASSSLAPCFPRQYAICNLSSLAVCLHSPWIAFLLHCFLASHLHSLPLILAFFFFPALAFFSFSSRIPSCNYSSYFLCKIPLQISLHLVEWKLEGHQALWETLKNLTRAQRVSSLKKNL